MATQDTVVDIRPLVAVVPIPIMDVCWIGFVIGPTMKCLPIQMVVVIPMDCGTCSPIVFHRLVLLVLRHYQQPVVLSTVDGVH